jgi:hypothetical protein
MSYLTENCQILTEKGMKTIGNLKVGDIVFDLNNKKSKIIKIWKGIKLMTEDIGTLDSFEGTSSYLIFYNKNWIPIFSLIIGRGSFLPKTGKILFQIQTDSYGVWSLDFILNTLTKKYIEDNPHVINNFI